MSVVILIKNQKEYFMSNIVKFTELDEEILELYTKGYNRKDIAYKLDLPIKTINSVFNKPNIKDKLIDVVEQRELLLKVKQSEILNELTDELVDNAENITDLLGKGRDILDVISVTNNVMKDTEKKRLGQSGENIIVNILNQLA